MGWEKDIVWVSYVLWRWGWDEERGGKGNVGKGCYVWSGKVIVWVREVMCGWGMKRDIFV